MPIYALPEEVLVFPHPLLTDDRDGLLAVGGSLHPDQLLLAYHFGIFPWFNPGEEIQWFFPSPRSVLFPANIRISKSMKPYFNQNKFRWTMNTCFSDVIRQCQVARERSVEGTWIGKEIIEGYSALHEGGFAHSVEVWKDNALVGGFYGVWLGKVFFGESMFSLVSNASKFGLINFVNYFAAKDQLRLIDCQIENKHLNSLGAQNIDPIEFLDLLKKWAWRSA